MSRKSTIDADAFDFGHRLQELRLRKGLTQKDVADKLKCHINTIGYYETNSRKPSYSIIRKLAFIYNTSTDYILNFADRASIFIDDLPKAKQDMILDLLKSMRQEEEQKNTVITKNKTGD